MKNLNKEKIIQGVNSLNEYAGISLKLFFGSFFKAFSIGEWHLESSLFSKMEFDQRYRKLFHSFLGILSSEGMIERDRGMFKVVSDYNLADLHEKKMQFRDRFLLNFPLFISNIQLLDHCILNYDKVLSGKTGHMEVLFSKGSLDLVGKIYNENDAAAFFNHFVADVILETVNLIIKSQNNKKVRILEIGAGTGGTTVEVLNKLSGLNEHLEYYYTDISKGFVNHGKVLFKEKRDLMEFIVLDIEGDITIHENLKESVDIIFASNVIHATKHIEHTLVNVNWLLKPQGLLVLNEITEINNFLTMTFGLSDGWWFYEDDMRLEGSPLLSKEKWCSVMLKAGFSNPRGYSLARPFQSLILSEKFERKSAALKKETVTENLAIAAIENKDKPTSKINRTRIQEKLVNIVAELLLIEESVNIEQSFADYGIDSLLGVKLIDRINQQFNLSLEVTSIYQYPDVKSLGNYVSELLELNKVSGFDDTALLSTVTESSAPLFYKSDRSYDIDSKFPLQEENLDTPAEEQIAIIGISGKFPAAVNTEEFWKNLKEGKKEFATDLEWQSRCGYNGSEEQQTQIKRAALLSDVDRFDTLFFEISPLEAQAMDPQQRLFLEESYKAIEDAGYSPVDFQGLNCGVFVGVGPSEYNYLSPENITSTSLTGNSSSVLASRISYFLNLRGPSIAIDTACSSSLTATSIACDYLRMKNINIAIAGGVSLLLGERFQRLLSKTGMLSPDGICRPFDSKANGFVPGEAVGAVILKRLSDAIKDNDHIYAVIKGNALNQDGKSNGITAPNPIAQADLHEDVYSRFKIDPSTISYVETHGTGTELGDPIEIKALSDSFKKYTSKKQFCALSSVKGNIGHTLQAAGISSLIKLVLAFKYEEIPAVANFTAANPHINFVDSPFYVADRNKKWVGNGLLRKAAISSFGMSGTNCHMVLEEYKSQPAQRTKGPSFIALSARDHSALLKKISTLKEWLTKQSDNVHVNDIIYTLNKGRTHFKHRGVVLFEDKDELLDKLKSGDIIFSDKEIHTTAALSSLDSIVRELYSSNSVNYLTISAAIAKIYLAGADIPWDHVFNGSFGRRISMPAYPLEGDSYWIYDKKQIKIEDQNESGCLNHLEIKRKFTVADEFVKQHVIHGNCVVPGVSILEFVRKSCESIYTNDALEWSNINWLKPIVINSSYYYSVVKLSIEKNRTIQFEVLSMVSGILVPNANGSVSPAKTYDKLGVTLLELESGATRKQNQHVFYDFFTKRGVNFGNSFQVVRKHFLGQGYVLAHIIHNEQSGLGYSPYKLDACFQSLNGIFDMGEHLDDLFVPVGFDKMVIPRSLPQEFYIYGIKENEKQNQYTVWLLDLNGRSFGQIKNVRAKLFQQSKFDRSSDIQLIQPRWEESVQGFISETPFSDPTNISILLYTNDLEIRNALRSFLKQHKPACRLIEVSVGERFQQLNASEFTLSSNNETDMETLFKMLSSMNMLPQFLIAWPEHGSTENSKPLWQIASVLLEENIYTFHKLLRSWAKYERGGKRVVTAFSNDGGYGLFSDMIQGFAKTIMQEDPKFIVSTLEINKQEADYISDVINEFKSEDTEVRIQNKVRKVKKYATQKWNATAEASRIKKNGVYLVCGGVGGIGKIVCKYLLTQYNAKIIITGRSKYEKVSDKLIQLGLDKSSYIQCDATKMEEVERLYFEIKRNYKELNGVFYLSGIILDEYLLKKADHDFKKVIETKVNGILNIDHVTRFESLDFFCGFSSLSSFYGNVGQGDYASANSFINSFSAYRNNLLEKGERSGKMISMAWGLWDAGMQVKGILQENFMNKTGMQPLSPAEGMAIMEDLLNQSAATTGIFKGDIQVLNASIHYTRTDIAPSAEFKPAVSENTFTLRSLEIISKIFGETIGLKSHQIDPSANFESYGLNSLIVVTLSDAFEKVFGPLSKTLFFEYFSLHELHEYFMNNHRQRLSQLISMYEPISPSAESPDQSVVMNKSEDKYDPVAVIGMSGEFASAYDLNNYWSMLCKGTDMIHEGIPESWSFSSIQEHNTSGKGGFISNHLEFDPLFFKISPREAKLMDPQERIFLMHSWKALEDAGYTNETIRQLNGKEQQVGVFAGVMWGTYSFYGVEEALKGDQTYPVSAYYAVANRVSSSLNFSGPSVSFDTACSSSLTAIHYACQSLRLNECDVALAGGVNLSLHPLNHMILKERGFLSPEGKCKSFGEGGEGYVPGEGVGVIVLKKLSKAIEDGDFIHGIIRASALNHGGKTSGYTVPNPVKQGELIEKVLLKSGIEVSSIGYIEAHGTGTTLGDPIEINGLKRAFNSFDLPPMSCAIGSVKSNMGHLEAASGIAGTIKVLLQMKNKKLVPSIHSETKNPAIDFGNSPFYIQQHLSSWNNYVDTNGKEFPLAAGVSSFGAGGSNAHILIEEFKQCTGMQITDRNEKPGTVAWILSAEDEQCLTKKAIDLYECLLASSYTIEQIAYTLQTGRRHLPVRVCFVGEKKENLLDDLQHFMESGKRKDKRSIALSSYSKASTEKDIFFIANYWEQGNEVDWVKWYEGRRMQRVPLPSHLFKSRKYWFVDSDSTKKISELTQSQRLFKKEWRACIESIDPLIGKEDVKTFVLLTKAQLKAELSTLKKSISNAIYIILGSENNIVSESDIIEVDVRTPDPDFIMKTLRIIPGIHKLIDCTNIGLYDDFNFQDMALWKFQLFQQLIKELRQQPLFLYYITKGILKMDVEQEQVNGAILIGTLKAISAEYKTVHAKIIDIDHASCKNAIDIANKEYNTNSEFTEICYRNKVRYVSGYKQIKQSESGSSARFTIDSSKYYIITGGTNGIGLSLAEYIIKKGAKKLVLMGRGSLPEPEKWDHILSAPDHYSKEVVFKVKKLQEYRNQGIEFIIYNGSLVDYDLLNGLLTTAQASFGQLGGCIHCAGKANYKQPAFIHKTLEEVKQVLEPKINGLIALDQLLTPYCPEFMILFSSSSVIPLLGKGASDYAGANEFMDYYATLKNKTGSIRYLSVNWTSWEASGAGAIKGGPYFKLGFETLDNETGFELLEAAYSTNESVLFAASMKSKPVSEEDWLKENPFKVIQTPDRALTKDKNPSNVLTELVTIISRTLDLKINEVDLTIPIQEIGVGLIEKEKILSKWKMNDKLDKVFSLEASVNDLVSLMNQQEKMELPLISQEKISAHNNAKNGKLTEGVIEILKGTLNLLQDEIDMYKRFTDYGVDSILLSELVSKIELLVGEPVEPSIILENDTLTTLIDYLIKNYADKIVIHQQGILSLSEHKNDEIQHDSLSVTDAKRISVATEDYALDLLMIAFNKMGGIFDRKEEVPAEQLREKLGIGIEFKSLFYALLDILENRGVLSMKLGTVFLQELEIRSEATCIQEKEKLKKASAQMSPHIDLVTRCIKAYPEILTGKTDAVSVLFQKGNLKELRKVYSDDPQLRELNNHLGNEIYSFVNEQKERSSVIRILEIGAGTGSTTLPVLKMLGTVKRKVEYFFTDVSLSFLKMAELDLQKQFPILSLELLDIEKGIEEQGFETSYFDVIIASNVLHATSTMSHTMQQIYKLLKPGAQLHVLELVQYNCMSTYTFGLLEGWWKFNDHQLRIPHSPLLSVAQWEELFRSSGMVQYATYPATQSDNGYFDYRVFSVTKPIYTSPTTEKKEQIASSDYKDKIAVIGMACKFAGSDDKHEFWESLRNGKSLITEVPDERWSREKWYSSKAEKGKASSCWGGFIKGVENFDNEYFRMEESLATEVDPAARLILEQCAEIFNDSGYRPKELSSKKVGVFIGARKSGYASENISSNTIVALGQNMIAGHVAHFFNLKGPAMVVDTACSSSLVSLHLAVQSLKLGESDYALAGGVDLLLNEVPYLLLSEAKVISKTNKSYAFDKRANGFIPGEGAGGVLLKRMDEAIRDGDCIYAVIEGIAVNNDGNTMGITTPNHLAQTEVITSALEKSKLTGDDIHHIEAHGTGTSIGDPIELRALKNAFGEHERKQYCGISTVKTNIGHLLCAAGIASFIKMSLCLYNKCWVPTLNADQPNVRFDFEDSPFYIQQHLQCWDPASEHVKRAGISSFGFGGTNAHTVLSEFKPEKCNNYVQKRFPLEPIKWNKKRLWLDHSSKIIKEQPISQIQDAGNDEIVMQRFFKIEAI